MPAKLAEIAGYLEYRRRKYRLDTAIDSIKTRLGGDRIDPLLLLIRLDNNGKFIQACASAYRLLLQVYFYLFIVGLLISSYPRLSVISFMRVLH